MKLTCEAYILQCYPRGCESWKRGLRNRAGWNSTTPWIETCFKSLMATADKTPSSPWVASDQQWLARGSRHDADAAHMPQKGPSPFGSFRHKILR